MKQHELPSLIYRWSKRIGSKNARAILINAGVGYTTAVFLANGTYKSEPKGKTKTRLENVLKGDL